MSFSCEHAIFTFNGIRFPVADVQYRRRETDYGLDLSAFVRHDTAPITFETTIPITGPEPFASLFPARPNGASPRTLARRVSFGGRKGRRALRRLYALAAPVELATADGLRFRGRCVMLTERELRIRMSQRSGRGHR